MPSSPNRMLSSALPPSRSSMRWTSVLRAMAGHPLLLGSENYSSDLKRKPCFEREWIGPGAIVLGTTSLPAVANPRRSRSWARGRFVDHRTWVPRLAGCSACCGPTYGAQMGTGDRSRLARRFLHGALAAVIAVRLVRGRARPEVRQRHTRSTPSDSNRPRHVVEV